MGMSSPTTKTDRSVDEGVGCSDTDSEHLQAMEYPINIKLHHFEAAEFLPIEKERKNQNIKIQSHSEYEEDMKMYNIFAYDNEEEYYRYSPPELINKNEINNKSDIYNYGLVLYELFSKGELPYWNLSINELSKLNKENPKKSLAMNLLKNPLFLRNSEISDLFGELILHCFHYEGNDRINLKSIKRILNRKIKKYGQNSN